MPNPADAVQTQLNNILAKTGRSLDELAAIASDSGLQKHGQLRTLFQDKLGLGYGDANALVHAIQLSDGERAAQAKGLSGDAVLDEIYSGPKAALRPIHDNLMVAISEFGEFEVSPKKGYVSLRTTRQFAMIGPATTKSVELGINTKSAVSWPGWTELAAGNMCNFKVRLTSPDEITPELIQDIRTAFSG